MILLDSDVVIAHLRGTEPARDWQLTARRQQPLAISALTIAEVAGGMRSGETPRVLGLALHVPHRTDHRINRSPGR